MNTKKHGYMPIGSLWICVLLLMGPGLDAFAQSPLTLNQVVELLESSVEEAEIIKQIEDFKVDFGLTLQTLQALIRAGATEALLNAIEDNRFIYLCEEVPPVQLRPQLAPQFKKQLERANVILSEVNGKAVFRWLGEDPAYQALACLCFRVLTGKRLKSPLPLDVINDMYREGVYIPPEKYNDDEKLRNVMRRVWNERYPYAADFNDIVESVGGESL